MNEITEIYASWPKKDHAYVDDVILGYNGVSDDTAFSVSKGDRIAIRLILAGRAFELLGYEEGRVEINDAILWMIVIILQINARSAILARRLICYPPY